MSNPDKITPVKLINWKEVEVIAKNLASKIKCSNKKYEGIIAVSKGGLIPAYFLSRELGIDKIEVVCTNHYNEEHERLPKPKMILGFTKTPGINYRDWLIVEDVVETGETLHLLKNVFPYSAVASLFKKSDVPVTYFGKLERSWIKFPWELN